MNHELPEVQAAFRKGRGTRGQIANIPWIIEKVREFQKSICFCFTDYARAFDCVDQDKLQKILKEMGIPDHLTCPLRNLHAGQEETVRTAHGIMDWFEIGKGVQQGCILSPYLFLRRQARGSSIPISLRIFKFVVIHTVKDFNIVSEAEVVVVVFSGYFLAFSMIQWMLTI